MAAIATELGKALGNAFGSTGGSLLATFNAGDGAYTLHNGHPFLLKDDVIYGSPIRSDGTAVVRAFSFDLNTEVFDYSDVRTSGQDDDHNNGNLIIDPVGDIVSVFGSDHNTGTTVRFHRGTSLDVDDIATSPTANITTTNPSYSSAFINPLDLDQVDVFFREGSFGTSSWRMGRSEDYDGTPAFSNYEFLAESYMDFREERTGSGIWAIPSGHTGAPSGHQDTTRVTCPSICLWHLDRSNDELSSGGNVEHTGITAGYTERHGHGWNQCDYGDKLNTNVDVLDQLTVTTGSTNDVFGGSGDTHRRLVATGTGTKRWAKNCGTSSIGEYYQADCLVKPNGTNNVMLGLLGGAVTAGSPLVYFDCTGAGSVNSSANVVATFITALDNGWYHIGLTILADDAVVMQFRVTPTDAAHSVSYTAAGEEIFMRAVQLCQNPYSGLSLRAYSQNLTDLKNPTVPPVVLYESKWGETVRVLDSQDTGTYFECVFVVLPGYTGSAYPTVGEVNHVRYHKTTYAVSTPVKIGDAGDGLNSDDDNSYLGGCIAGPLEVLYDRQNHQGNGEGQIIRAVSNDEGLSWSNEVVLSSASEVLMRPLVIKEQFYTGGTLTWGFSRYVAIMRGTYTNYDAGNFDTEVDILQLV